MGGRFSLRATLSALAAALAAAAVLACGALTPAATPEQACLARCRGPRSPCSAAECERGCGLALDKLVEGQGPTILACVARARRCDDPTWARCAVYTGRYADGGPPPPPPPREWDDDEPAATPPTDDPL